GPTECLTQASANRSLKPTAKIHFERKLKFCKWMIDQTAIESLKIVCKNGITMDGRVFNPNAEALLEEALMEGREDLLEEEEKAEAREETVKDIQKKDEEKDQP